MKKVSFLLITLISIFAFDINVFAASGNLGVSSTSVYVGDNFTVTVNVDSVAAWNVHVSASGPVSGCIINQADATDDAMDTNKTFSATCTATGEGTITIRLDGDVTSASDGNAVNISGSKSVSVSKRPTPPSSNNGNNNNSGSNSNNSVDNRSKNNNIKDLSADGYDLTKVDDNNYTLTVSNDVTSISVNATAEDSKAKVDGTGSHELNVGENNIEVIITSESGARNKINIIVTRKDGYYLEDLDSVLKNNKTNDINITINSDTKISSQDLEKIKDSKKTVKFNYYNGDKNLMYSWIIDGLKVKNTNDLLTTISYETENRKDILKLSNYADGLFISAKQYENLPEGVRIRLYVGNKFDDNDLVNVYAYRKNDDKLSLAKSKIKAEDGYIEFDVIEASDYLVTMSTIVNSNEIAKSSNNIVRIVILILVLLALVGFIVLFLSKKKKSSKKTPNGTNSGNIDYSNDDGNNDNNSLDDIIK